MVYIKNGKKMLDEPIFIDNIEELKKLSGYYACLKITFICLNCGKEETKTLSAIRRTLKCNNKLYCIACFRRSEGIKKYGSEELFNLHLQQVYDKGVNTLIEKEGTLENIYKKRVESYEKTCLERYGVTNTSKLDKHRKWMSENNIIHLPGVLDKAKKLIHMKNV